VITIKKMEHKAEEYEARAATLRQAIALMNGEARVVKAKRIGSIVDAAIKTRGHRNGHGPAAAPGGHAAKVRANREATFRALAIVAERGPLTSEGITEATGIKAGWIGPMVSRGYLVGKKGGAYARTKKAFRVDPERPA
jgi:hypothetical protein